MTNWVSYYTTNNFKWGRRSWEMVACVCMWEGVLLSHRFGMLGVASFSHLMLVYVVFLAFCGLVKKILGQSREEGRERLDFLLKKD